MRRVWFLGLLVAGCSGPAPVPQSLDQASDPAPLHADGLHNLFRVSDRVYSGSSPEGDAAFAALRDLGVKTVITVDGAAPDVATAEKYGLRYVHLPVGYDGIPQRRAWELAKAVRESPGPVYVHCHHGQHRGPAAVAAVQLCLDPAWTPERAAAWMTAAGTDPKYTGLTGLPKTLTKPTAADLDRLPSDFPSVAAVPDLTKLMVDVDARWDHLKLVKTAGWATPTDHPDVDPPHEAVILAELFREAARLPEVKAQGAGFLKAFTNAEAVATELATALRAKDSDTAAKAFTKSQAACASCHSQHRDRK